MVYVTNDIKSNVNVKNQQLLLLDYRNDKFDVYAENQQVEDMFEDLYEYLLDK